MAQRRNTPFSAAENSAFNPSAKQLHSLYDRLLQVYGPQHWWPAETPFEVMVGAILTQNAAWTNVEKAIANLKSADALSPEGILQMEQAELAGLLRPSGYFNIKAVRLTNFCRYLIDAGGEEALAQRDTADLRKGLLGVNGVGPETADDMLLYAFERPVFVIDAYTRRLLQRFGLASGNESYEDLRSGFEQSLKADAEQYKQYHALIVTHAKEVCRVKPVCADCRLAADCLYYP